MNLATIEAIRQGIAEIAQQAETCWSGDDYNAGATDIHRRIDNYLCELIAENGGDVKEPEVFRYFEVRTFGNPIQKTVHREKEYGGSTYFWERRMKELEKKVNNPGLFAEVFEYDTEQLLIDYFLEADKEPEPEIPWDDIESWAEFVSMDADGQWWQYEDDPRLLQSLRGNTPYTNAQKINIFPFTVPDWRSSLRQRPAKTAEQ